MGIPTSIALSRNVVEAMKDNTWVLLTGTEDINQRLVIYNERLKKSFENFQNRTNDISLQIEQLQPVTRTLKLWNEEIDKLENNISIQNFNDLSISNLYSDFEIFLHHSNSDHNSNSDYICSIFYAKPFDMLHDVNEKITEIRRCLEDLKAAINAIPSKDFESWQIHLPTIKFLLNNLKIRGHDLSDYCVALLAELMHELIQLATMKTNFQE